MFSPEVIHEELARLERHEADAAEYARRLRHHFTHCNLACHEAHPCAKARDLIVSRNASRLKAAWGARYCQKEPAD
jgi:hypothetical protein